MDEFSTTSQPNPLTQVAQILDELATTTDVTLWSDGSGISSTTTPTITTLDTEVITTTPSTTRSRTTTTTTQATTLAIFIPGFFGGNRAGSEEEITDETAVNEKKGFIDEIRSLLLTNFVEEGNQIKSSTNISSILDLISKSYSKFDLPRAFTW